MKYKWGRLPQIQPNADFLIVIIFVLIFPFVNEWLKSYWIYLHGLDSCFNCSLLIQILHNIKTRSATNTNEGVLLYEAIH